MNYWAVPGIKRTIIFGAFNLKTKKVLRENLSICPNSGVVHFYQGAAVMMQLKVKDKVNFLVLGDAIYLYKSNDGVSIRRGAKTNVRTQSRPLGKFLKDAMLNKNINSSYSQKCGVKKTNSEFNGSVLFEIILPKRVKNAIRDRSKN